MRKLVVVLLLAALLLGGVSPAQGRVLSRPWHGPRYPRWHPDPSFGRRPATFFYYGEISAITQRLAMQIFDPLIYFDLETYELIPGLTREWTISEDGKT